MDLIDEMLFIIITRLSHQDDIYIYVMYDNYYITEVSS